MTSGKRAAGALAVAALVAGLAAACGGTNTKDTTGGQTAKPGDQGSNLAGEIKVDGSSTVAPLTTAASELFKEKHPKVNVPVGTSGTGGGFEKFCAGEIAIADASRKIKDDAKEKQACAAKGIKYGELQVATDALTVVVHKDNTWAKCLTVPQLKKIWEPDSKVKSWNQVDPKFPNEPLKLAGAGTDSGTFDYFTKEINGKEKASRKDYSASENDNDTVNTVASSKGGLGYFGFSYFEENQSKLKTVEIDGGGGCVAPSVESAQSGKYKPLSRPLFIYPNLNDVKRLEVKAFLDFYVGNIGTIAKDAKFVPLNPEQEAKLKADLDALKAQAG